MSDSCEATDGMELAVDMARKLNKIKPDHELLNLFTQADDDAVWNEFQTRFGKPGITKQQRATAPAQGYFWAQYFLALKKTVEGLEAASATT